METTPGATLSTIGASDGVTAISSALNLTSGITGDAAHNAPPRTIEKSGLKSTGICRSSRMNVRLGAVSPGASFSQ
jgi:hypothetical protein